ncbi:hypothetical protein C349_04180 [Cryptococcus neoformans var. grubii Br795]|nr:hypothetical protein C353_04157 [Cryptococcus neoformans var. grubii AD1-83a]OWZ53305.1 hypothetical protein C368_04323 [Cryptococcus neoformans var. grubii 125.91]OXG30609.1 hypothetical protein C360_04984 [Cryptococcus neoformans var. grubii Bt15]OXG48823.1 hypothetical protein C355_03962 [Cryptococcus neoformans var. grubii Th84]OXG56232.1 hypothetical protein C354_04092 [Cryptococcus neoformans var. grubii MW-RSA1955]OXG60398.1 hypothetical protein C352_04093 [Cryptococcus neoformans va
MSSFLSLPLLFPLGLSAFTVHLLVSTLASRPKSKHDALPSYLVPSIATHGRLLPASSRNAFSYPCLHLAVDIDSLTSGCLDLPFRLFKYGGSPFCKILGLRAEKYLTKGSETYREKLEKLLSKHGIAKERMGKVWLTTMPSLLGYEGDNPLTTWYIYEKATEGKEGELLAIVLEVHSAFDESHSYTLTPDSPLRHEPAKGYDFGFTIPRSFHVSPFNSRDGYYRVDIINPFPVGHTKIPGFVPSFKIFLRVLSTDKKIKFMANSISGPSPPLRLERGMKSVVDVLWALTKWPGTLFLVRARTNWQAYILHYRKNLALYPRPEPINSFSTDMFNQPEKDEHGVGVPLQKSPITSIEKRAQEVVCKWAAGRAEELRVRLEIEFEGDRDNVQLGPQGKETLNIKTADSDFFNDLLITPSPQHFLILAHERYTEISNPLLFKEFFSAPLAPQADWLSRSTNAIRRRYFVHLYSYSHLPPPPSIPPITGELLHFSDSTLISFWDRFKVLRVVFWTWYGHNELEWIFGFLRGAFVPGQEAWTVWDRAMRRSWGEDMNAGEMLGSVRL